MRGFILSPAAQRDVDGIWTYTAHRWNEEQAARYLRQIRDACRALADGTLHSRTVDIRDGYRKALVGSHVLFFKTANDGTVVIIRILHQRQDANRHL